MKPILGSQNLLRIGGRDRNNRIGIDNPPFEEIDRGGKFGIVILHGPFCQVILPFETDLIQIVDGTPTLVFYIVDREDNRFDFELFKKIFKEGGA
jgi:hypothetical protein